MRWRLVGLAIVSCLLAAVTGVLPAAAAPAQAGPWGTAQTLTLPPVINFGQFATINSIACPTAGNCTAVGHFTDAHDHIAAIAASETKHVWAAAVQPLGTVLSGLSAPDLLGVSCLSPGNCYAVGVVTINQAWTAGLLLREVKGAWNFASYLSSDDKGTQVSAVSCPSAGNCVAAGQYVRYVAPNVSTQAFAVTEKAGSWSAAREVPGTSSLNVDGLALVNSVSCAPGSGSPNCVLGGYYLTAPGSSQRYEAFVADLKGFAWQSVEEVPGIGTLNVGKTAQLNTVSCPSPGFCAAGGFYSDGHFGDTLAFVDNGAIS